jgi:hypothetical protein
MWSAIADVKMMKVVVVAAVAAANGKFSVAQGATERNYW